MPDLVNAFFEERLGQLFDLAGIVERLIGGLAAHTCTDERERLAERPAMRESRRVFRSQTSPRRRAIHLYPEATPELGPCRRIKGLRLVPLADLVRRKLTRFRFKDQMHLKHLDEAGLITPAGCM